MIKLKDKFVKNCILKISRPFEALKSSITKQKKIKLLLKRISKYATIYLIYNLKIKKRIILFFPLFKKPYTLCFGKFLLWYFYIACTSVLVFYCSLEICNKPFLFLSRRSLRHSTPPALSFAQWWTPGASAVKNYALKSRS